MKIGISYSGGLDSFILRHYAKINHPDAEVECIYFDIGQDYATKEIATLPDFVEARKVDWLQENQALVGKEGSKSGNIIIPGRNMVLATLMASIALPDEIWMGALLGETHAQSTDKNYEFLEHINKTLGYVYGPFKENITVRFPLADDGMGKFETVQWAFDNGITAEQLMSTSSCLSAGPVGHKCGTCVVCCRRWGIFNQFSFTEEYETHPMKGATNKAMVIEMLKGEHGGECHYDAYRRREIIPTVYAFYGTHDRSELEGILR